jgi:hypothetical protein
MSSTNARLEVETVGEKEWAKAAHVIFTKERTHNQGELDIYREMAPAKCCTHYGTTN